MRAVAVHLLGAEPVLLADPQAAFIRLEVGGARGKTVVSVG